MSDKSEKFDVIHERETPPPCDHEFTQEGDPDKDYCIKCGMSVWRWAFTECP